MTEEGWVEADQILAEAGRLYRAVERSVITDGPCASLRGPSGPHWALERFRRASLARLEHEKSTLVRDALLIVQLCGRSDDAGLPVDRSRIRAEIAPESPIWGRVDELVHPALLDSVAYDDDEGEEYLEAVRVGNPDPRLRSDLTESAFRLAVDQRNPQRWKALLADLSQLGQPDEQLQPLRDLASQVESLSPGRPAPGFDVPALDPADGRYTLESFRGRHLLLHFWGTWCTPCIEDLSTLHDIYADYGPSRLEILSLAEDDSPTDVRAFQSEPGHAMPWRHSFVGNAHPGGVADAYLVMTLPRMAFIDPDGRLVAEERSVLSGAELRRTITTHVGAS
jgi:thiol-disulfide isomerase/thioredoxin